jgi:hypothetical protein
MLDFKAAFTYTNGVDFPNTTSKNSTNGTSFDGTHFNEAYINDWWGFCQAALNAAGAAPNGQPEASDNSQILNAIVALTSYQQKIYNWSGECYIADSIVGAHQIQSNVVAAEFSGLVMGEYDVDNYIVHGALTAKADMNAGPITDWSGTIGDSNLKWYFNETLGGAPAWSFAPEGAQGIPIPVLAWTNNGGYENAYVPFFEGDALGNAGLIRDARNGLCRLKIEDLPATGNSTDLSQTSIQVIAIVPKTEIDPE